MAKEREKRSARGEEGQSKRKTMLLPVTAGHSGKIREQRCEPAYVHADHEKRTDATRQTVDVHQRTFPLPNRCGGLGFPPVPHANVVPKENNNSYKYKREKCT